MLRHSLDQKVLLFVLAGASLIALLFWQAPQPLAPQQMMDSESGLAGEYSVTDSAQGSELRPQTRPLSQSNKTARIDDARS